MKSHLRKFLPLGAALLLLTPLVLSSTATAAPTHAACGTAAPDLDPVQGGGKAHGLNMRSGSSTACAITGVVYSANIVNYHCWTTGSGGTWTYGRNITATYAGWMRDDLLNDGGSKVWCGF